MYHPPILLRHLIAFGALLCFSDPLVLNDDGGWCWFQDPRVLVVDGKLFFGSVASGYRDPARRGDVEVTSYDLETAERTVFELHDRLQLDDHNAPALLERPDGRLVAVYTRHGEDDVARVRISEQAGDASRWTAEQQVTAGASVTYSNLFYLSEANDGRGRVFDFHRGKGWDPNLLVSDDLGESWRHGGRLLGGPGRPYLRYATDGRATVHFIATEQHPRDYDNGVYHGFLRAGVLHRSGGEVIGRVGAKGAAPEQLTQVFAGGAAHVAWTVDLELDGSGHPVAILSVQRDGAGRPPGEGGLDHRFHYARWDGERWNEHEMCFAGTRLYAGEDDYTGLAAIDPDDPDVVFVSTDADPVTGAPLVSATDGARHREIYRGETRDGGVTFAWKALTRDSDADNLRPVVPRWKPERTAVLWLRGVYRSYQDYELEVVGKVLEE